MHNQAYEIACIAHKGQVDKAGKPYINHPVTVANMVSSSEAKTVAYLHDVVEDTYITLEDLKAIGFSKDVIDAVDCLTKRDAESYGDYLKRLCKKPLAVEVKIADVTHNLDITRIPNPSEKDFARVRKYTATLQLLKSVGT